MDTGRKYDIFISYRRSTGREASRTLQLALEGLGYSVFFDYNSIRDGKFNETIYSAIDACEVFILMMTEGSLDNCSQPGDWVCREIVRALEKKRRVVLVGPSNQRWSFPADLPPELAELRAIQVSTLDMETLFKESVAKIESDRFPAELRARCHAAKGPGEIFISHAPADAARVKELADEIGHRTGVTPWMDPNGSDLDLAIDKVQSCQVFVLVLTANALCSNRTMAQIILAQSQKKKIYPVFLDHLPEAQWNRPPFTFDAAACIDYADAVQRETFFQSLGPLRKTEVDEAWKHLDGAMWVDLLIKQPHLAVHCAWEKLDGEDWCRLLQRQPQFAVHCVWDKVHDYWVDLLVCQPQLADNCPWEKLSADYWYRHILMHPWFIMVNSLLADHCPWEKLDGAMWVNLLISKPYLADHCAWEKLGGADWSKLLQEQTQFADHCAWEKLDGRNWSGLLHCLPQFSDRCPWIRPLEKRVQIVVGEGEDWKLPLAIVQKPELFEQDEIRTRFAGLLELGMDGVHYKDSWTSAVIFSDEGKSLGSVNPWAFVLYYRPELAEKCTVFEKFNGYSRCILLMKQPQFADRWSMEELGTRHGACWANLNDGKCEDAWEELLAAQPQFAKWKMD